MSDSPQETVQDLFLPYIAVIPYRVQADENIPDSAKIYFGQVTALCQKYGYCWATDDQLSKMKSVPIGTIKRWNTILEKAGYFTRITKMVVVNANVLGEKPRFVKKRKIYVNEAFANQRDTEFKKCFGSLKNETSLEGLKNETSLEGLKNETYNNKQEKEIPKTQQQETGKDQPLPGAVVVVSIDEEEKRKLLEPFPFAKEVVVEFTQKYDLTHLNDAVLAHYQFSQTKTIDNELGCLRRAITEGWKPKKTINKKLKEQEDTNVEDFEKQKAERTSCGQIFRKKAKEIEEKWSEKFTENLKFTVHDDHVFLITPDQSGKIKMFEQKWDQKLENALEFYTKQGKENEKN